MSKDGNKGLVLFCAIMIVVMLFLGFVGIIVSSLTRKGYNEIFKVTDVEGFRKHFVVDNPNGDGTDPTQSMVDYSYIFPRDGDGKMIPNVNGDTTWQDISENQSLITDDEGGGIIIKLADSVENGTIGAPRVMSRKLYRGGLFIFDVEHCPIGCGVWPAIWLNGFVAAADQYHEKKGTSLYQEGMKKLAASTISKENFDRTCSGPTESLVGDKPDPHLSEYMGKNIYPSSWPTGGEFDIFEQTNFSDTNLVSIHSGPMCEVMNGYENEYMIPLTDPDYTRSGARSACGASYWGGGLDSTEQDSYGLGPYSGCKNTTSMVGEVGGDTTKLPNGSSRYNCPKNAASNAGNTQINAPLGSFGELFNQNNGGVWAVQWTPNDRVNVWWWPRQLFSDNGMKKKGGPLSKNPIPSKWLPKMVPDVQSTTTSEQKVLVASYILNNNNTLSSGCDFNYQGIIINIAMGGGWGGSSMPTYCSVDNKSEWRDYITKCFNANPENAIVQGYGVDPDNGCFDGAMSSEFRGINSLPKFYKESYFKIRSIRVLQNSDTDDNVW